MDSAHDSAPIDAEAMDVTMLPFEVWNCIGSHFSVQDVARLSLVSSAWRANVANSSLWDGLYARRWKHSAPGLREVGEGLLWGYSENKVPPFALRWERVTRSVREAHRIFSQQVEDRYSTVNLVELNDRWNPMCTAVKLAGAEWPDVKEFFLTSRHSLVNLLGAYHSVTYLHIPVEEVKEAIQRAGVGGKAISLRWWSLGGLQDAYGVARAWRGRDDVQWLGLTLETVMDSVDFWKIMERGCVHEVRKIALVDEGGSTSGFGSLSIA